MQSCNFIQNPFIPPNENLICCLCQSPFSHGKFVDSIIISQTFFVEFLAWTGLKKGPPRKLKFPEVQIIVENMKKEL